MLEVVIGIKKNETKLKRDRYWPTFLKTKIYFQNIKNIFTSSVWCILWRRRLCDVFSRCFFFPNLCETSIQLITFALFRLFSLDFVFCWFCLFLVSRLPMESRLERIFQRGTEWKARKRELSYVRKRDREREFWERERVIISERKRGSERDSVRDRYNESWS